MESEASGSDLFLSPRRLLMTTDAVGGVWNYSLDLSRALSSPGIEILLATMGPRPSAAQRQEAARIPRLTLEESDFSLEWTPDPWREVDTAGSWLLGLAARFQPDIVHLNGYAHAGLSWTCPVAVVAHSCVFSWWRAVHQCAPGPDWDEYKRRVMHGLRHAHAVVAPSAAMAASLSAEYDIAALQPQVIHNFTSIPLAGDSGKQPFFLAASRFDDRAKNRSLLERIAPRVPWPVRIAGNEPDSPVPHLQFLGRLPHPQLLAEMRRASVFLHPALYEPFGLSVLEAARSGCCLVLADIPSLRELWHGAALFLPPRDPAAWVDALNRLVSDAPRRASLAQLAQSRSATYSADSALRLYRAVYRRLLNSSAEAAA